MDKLVALPFAFYARNAMSLALKFTTHQGKVYHIKEPHTLASKVRSGDAVSSVVYNGIILREDWVAMVLERVYISAPCAPEPPAPEPQQAARVLRKRPRLPARFRHTPPKDIATELYLIRKLLEELKR